MELNNRINLLEAEADAIHYGLAGGMAHQNKSMMQKAYIKRNLFIASSHQEVSQIYSAYRRALGNPGRGNSRTGNERFYKDLILLFFRIKKSGINLPRWNISKKHLRFGIYNVLKEHGYIPDAVSEDLFYKNTSIRNWIHHKVERIFVRVASAIEKTPAKIESTFS